MRIAGTFLLIGGFLLCVSIVWAALGFLMMGFGLICFLIAERRKVQSADSTASRPDKMASRQESSLPPERKNAQASGSSASRSDEIDSRREPSLFPERSNAQPSEPATSRSDEIASRREPSPFPARKKARSAGLAASRSDKIDQGERSRFSEPKAALVLPEERTDQPQSASGLYSQDTERWISLVKNDADISRSVAALAPFGKKYVDELARAYLVLNDKDYLPIILKKIAASVRKDSGKDVASAVAADSNPNMDLISFALGQTRGLRVEQVLNARAVHDAVTDNAPQIKPDTKQKQTAVQSALKISRGRPGGTARELGIEETDARRAVKIATIAPATREAAGTLGLDDAEALTDLLNRIDLDIPTRGMR